MGDTKTPPALEQWGRHLEDELVWVEPIVMYAVNYGSIEAPTAWVRGRDAPMRLCCTADDAWSFVESTWITEIVFFVRQVPALRFDTGHGSVIVTDLWTETRFGALSGKRGQSTLRIHMPLMPVARHVEEARRPRRAPTPPQITVMPIGWTATEPLAPRMRLRAWSSMVTGEEAPEGEGASLSWLDEPNACTRSGVQAVVKSFLAVNSPEELALGRSLAETARRRSIAHAGVDVDQGLARLEQYVNEQE